MRTPSQHRAEVDTWRADAPKDDSDIFHDQWEPHWGGGKPRHASLAVQLAALIELRNRPEKEQSIGQMETNWSVVPDGRKTDAAGLFTERGRDISPSVDEITASLSDVVVTYHTGPKSTCNGGKGEIHALPVDGDIERNDAGQVTRIGKLRFSDGLQTEKAYKTSPDGSVIQYDARLPTGAMLHTKDETKGQLGGQSTKGLAASNKYFADMLCTTDHRYITGNRKTRRGKSYTASESKAMLANAWSNTKCPPTVTKCPDGLPCGSARVADSFVGLKKGRCGDSGAQAWEDIATSIVNREIWDQTLAALSERDTRTLEAALKAPNMQAVGSAMGFSGKQAERRGRQALLAANDNFSSILKKKAA